MSISSVSTNSPTTYQYSPTSATTTSTSSPIVASNDPGLAQQVSSLSTTAAVVASLGSSSSSDSLTYDAAGLYNSIAQAGSSATTTSIAVPAAGSNTQSTASQSLNSAIVSTLPNSSTASGFYTGSGVLQSDSATGSNLTANWASALKENPSLSSNVAADSYAQGIIGTISVTA